jgi:lipopolysaccharide-induced tumor necrosis factor-alpha factor
MPEPQMTGIGYNNGNGDVQEKNNPFVVPQQQNMLPPHDYSQQYIAPKNNYQNATPLASLQQGPAPVDCPVCNVREMTRTEYVSGGTTQLVNPST